MLADLVILAPGTGKGTRPASDRYQHAAGIKVVERLFFGRIDTQGRD